MVKMLRPSLLSLKKERNEVMVEQDLIGSVECDGHDDNDGFSSCELNHILNWHIYCS